MANGKPLTPKKILLNENRFTYICYYFIFQSNWITCQR